MTVPASSSRLLPSGLRYVTGLVSASFFELTRPPRILVCWMGALLVGVVLVLATSIRFVVVSGSPLAPLVTGMTIGCVVVV